MAVGRINVFFYKEMFGRFAGPKKVAVARGSTVSTNN